VTRVAVVDLGTNSTRLLVADIAGDEVREVERRLIVTRLGEAVDERRRLLPTAVARVRNALVEYRRIAEELGAERTLAIATSAVRDADNGEAFLGEIEWSYGFATRLLSGDDEAQTTFRGVAAGRRLPAGTVVVDVGGGSTELIGGGPDGVDFQVSVDLGCVRLTERFLASDPPGSDELAASAAHIRRVLADALPTDLSASGAIGVAGTVTTLATLDLGLGEEDPALVHGHRIGVARIEATLAELARLRVEEIARRPGIHPDRAPVIVAGIIVVLETLRRLGLDQLEVSEYDLMHGAALGAAELRAAIEGEAPPGAYTCC
jgi:exopolyphosphatase / guanosine-5'-triphosphate,3'-diphosphate pyrophosphatase